MWPPLAERRTPEVANGPDCCGGSTDLGVPERGVVSKEVVYGDDVVGFFVMGRSSCRRRRTTAVKTHGIKIGTLNGVNGLLKLKTVLSESSDSYRERKE